MERTDPGPRRRWARSLALLALVLPSCDDGAEDPPSLPRLVILAVTDPVFEGGGSRPASLLWYSTREGRAWVADRTGNPVNDAVHASGGELVRSDVAVEQLAPGDNQLEVILAPDSGGEALRAVAVVSVDAECTRSEHCAEEFHCSDFACVPD